jgi:hypothetical protein
VVDFVEEVEEQLRSDRYRTFAMRAWPWFLAALLAVVIGWLAAWGYSSWRDRDIGRASIAYDKAITTLAQGDPTGAYAALQTTANSGPAGYRTLALLQQGDIRATAGKTADAVALYDAAAKAAPNNILGDFARLRAAQVLLDGTPYAQIETRLKPLIGDKKPFDLEAKEMLAMARLLAGQTAAAKSDFTALSLTLGVSQAMRARAEAAIALIDSGQAGVVASAAKAAATLPPLPPQSVMGDVGAGPPSQDGQPQQGAADDTAAGPAGNTQ